MSFMGRIFPSKNNSSAELIFLFKNNSVKLSHNDVEVVIVVYRALDEVHAREERARLMSSGGMGKKGGVMARKWAPPQAMSDRQTDGSITLQQIRKIMYDIESSYKSRPHLVGKGFVVVVVVVENLNLCRFCNEIHVGPVGHPFKSCKGANANIRKGVHEWIPNVTVDDIFLPVEAFHLYDRLGRRIPHEERFSTPRVPAIVELCIPAGVDVPEYPTTRRRKPIIRILKGDFVDADESELPDPDSEAPKRPVLTEISDSEVVAPTDEEETTLLTEETLRAWEQMRRGAKRLMKMYLVRVCGYCPEVHVGPSGHKAQNCGAFKHQQRNGQHGWQTAVLNDLIPPRYVWHVPDVNGSPLQWELRNFYGQAPAVVEMCIQAGAAVPEEYRPTMRLDVGIPSTIKEAEMVV
nr:APO protein 2, chloroplastic-like [Malus domestica]